MATTAQAPFSCGRLMMTAEQIFDRMVALHGCETTTACHINLKVGVSWQLYECWHIEDTCGAISIIEVGVELHDDAADVKWQVSQGTRPHERAWSHGP